MGNKKVKFIIIGIVLVLIIALVVFFMVNKGNTDNQNAENVNNPQINEETDPVPDDEPIENPKNTEYTPIIE